MACLVDSLVGMTRHLAVVVDVNFSRYLGGCIHRHACLKLSCEPDLEEFKGLLPSMYDTVGKYFDLSSYRPREGEG